MTPIFLLIDQLLYQSSTYWQKINKIWKLEVNQKTCFSTTAPSKTLTIMAIRSLEKRGLGWFLAWKKVPDCNNLLNGSIHIEFNQCLPSSPRKDFIWLPYTLFAKLVHQVLIAVYIFLIQKYWYNPKRSVPRPYGILKIHAVLSNTK